MFNKELFLSLCGKYNVELSDTSARPMIKEGTQISDITDFDVHRLFTSRQIYFDYSDNISCAVCAHSVYYLQEEYGIAC